MSAASSAAPQVAERMGRRALPLVVPLAAFVLWWASSAAGWLPASILPRPSAVVETLGRLIVSGSLWSHVGVSILRVVQGLVFGTVLGLLIGIGMGFSPRLRDYLLPTFRVFVYVPILAWLPILMLLIGLDEALKVVLITKAVLVPVALHAYNGVRDVPLPYYEVGRVNRLTDAQIALRIVLPAAMAPVSTGIRYAHGRAWTALVIVELLASSEGLGYLMVEGQQLLQLDLQLAAIFVLAVIGATGDRLLALGERRLLRWRRSGFHEARA